MINNPTPEAKLEETPCTKALNTKVTLHLHHTKADLKLWQDIYIEGGKYQAQSNRRPSPLRR